MIFSAHDISSLYFQYCPALVSIAIPLSSVPEGVKLLTIRAPNVAPLQMTVTRHQVHHLHPGLWTPLTRTEQTSSDNPPHGPMLAFGSNPLQSAVDLSHQLLHHYYLQILPAISACLLTCIMAELFTFQVLVANCTFHQTPTHKDQLLFLIDGGIEHVCKYLFIHTALELFSYQRIITSANLPAITINVMNDYDIKFRTLAAISPSVTLLMHFRFMDGVCWPCCPHCNSTNHFLDHCLFYAGTLPAQLGGLPPSTR